MSTPTAGVETITPKVARELLNANASNQRNVKDRRIAYYAQLMDQGKWYVGQPLMVDTDQRVIDGQHRLLAVEKHGKPVDFMVIRGVAPESMATIDTGITRNGADTLTILGLTGGAPAKDLHAVASVHWALKTGRLIHNMSNPNASDVFGRTEVVEYIRANPHLAEATKQAKRLTNLRLPVGAVATAWEVFSEIDADAAAEFFARAQDFRTKGPGDPVHTLLTRIAGDRQGGHRIQPARALYYLFRAWNADRRHEALTRYNVGAPGSWALIPKAV